MTYSFNMLVEGIKVFTKRKRTSEADWEGQSSRDAGGGGVLCHKAREDGRPAEGKREREKEREGEVCRMEGWWEGGREIFS